jgi:hypothetical protein
MNELESQAELISRIDLIEAMVQEGRRKIEYWGWTQVLWGTAYLIAIGWAYQSGNSALPWGVTMIAATIVTIVVSLRKKRAGPSTANSRAVGAIWIAVGSALFLYGFSVGASGHAEIHAYMAAIEILLGVANFSGGLILRWRAPRIVGIVWWAAAVATAFVPALWVIPILVAATLIGMIGFGFYLMIRERTERRRRMLDGASHA